MEADPNKCSIDSLDSYARCKDTTSGVPIECTTASGLTSVQGAMRYNGRDC